MNSPKIIKEIKLIIIGHWDVAGLRLTNSQPGCKTYGTIQWPIFSFSVANLEVMSWKWQHHKMDYPWILNHHLERNCLTQISLWHKEKIRIYIYLFVFQGWVSLLYHLLHCFLLKGQTHWFFHEKQPHCPSFAHFSPSVWSTLSW